MEDSREVPLKFKKREYLLIYFKNAGVTLKSTILISQ